MPDHLPLSYAKKGDPWLQRWSISTIEYLTGRAQLERFYTEVRAQSLPGHLLWDALLEKLRITVDFLPAQLERIPRSGPVVFLANHPFGVVDGLIFGKIIAARRDRFAILVNDVLCREPQLAPYLLPIDFQDTPAALATNLATRQEALQRLSRGEAIGIFPGGGIATARPPWGQARELPWKRFPTKLIRQGRATVVPLFFPGQNSFWFHLASQISPSLRLSLLLREARRLMGQTVSVQIGGPIPYEELAAIRNRQQLLQHLQQCVERLAPGPLLGQQEKGFN
jgi:putative hemolysin